MNDGGEKSPKVGWEQDAGNLESAALAIFRAVRPLSAFSIYLGAFFALGMAVLVVVDILLRQFFNRPMSGVVELETFMVAVLCFVGLAYTQIKGGHVSVDLFVDKIPPKVRRLLDCLFPAFGLFLFGVITWQYGVRVFDSIKLGEISDVLVWPFWPFFLITAFGCALLALVFLAETLNGLAKALRDLQRAHLWLLLMILITGGVLASPLLLRSVAAGFKPAAVGTVGIAFMLVLMFLGCPVAFSMGLTGVLGTWYLVGTDTVMGIIKMGVYDAVATFLFCTVPFFVLMGILCSKAGIGQRLYEAGNKWFGWLPGGLAVGTVAACGFFAAVTGDTVSGAATMGSVALPEMKRYKYRDSLATGSVAAGGTLGVLIPPSLGFILYALVTQESVGKLFMAGILPGLLLVFLFSLSIVIRCKLDPTLGPKAPKTSFREKIAALGHIWPVLFLFALVMGGIYTGLFTSIEAGGVGAVGALLLALRSKSFRWRQFLESLLTTVQLTAMVTAIMVGVSLLGYFVTLTGIPSLLANFVSSLDASRWVIFLVIVIFYLVLGMLMNIMPMILLTLPILFPTIKALGFDPIWFGVIMVILVELGCITPPVGMNVFVVAGVAKDVPMSSIFKGIFPFVVVELFLIFLLAVFPGIALLLPNAMKN
jgi:tripartite ATP-independent transporter DctM subunit